MTKRQRGGNTFLALAILAGAGPCLAQPVTGHPRLLVRAQDLDRLRAWAVPSNAIYQDGLAVVATLLKEDMDAGRVPNQDGGGPTGEGYPTEMYAEVDRLKMRSAVADCRQ